MATISEAFAIAIQHHQAGRLSAAEQIYRQILAAEPNQPDAIHLLGVIASQAGKHEVAVDYIERAIRLRGGEAVFHFNLGSAYRALGKAPEAVACLRRALELKPDFAQAHSNLGDLLRDQGKHEEAVACYRRVVELKPDDAEALSNLGAACFDHGKLDESLGCYRRALQLKPDHAEVHYNLGRTLEGLGKLEESLTCWRRALDLKPDFAEAHVNLGSALKELGDLQGAENSFRAALRHNPRLAFAHGKLAEILGGNLPENELAAQLGLLEDIGLTDAERLALHFGLAQVLDARGEHTEAAAHLARGNALQLSDWRKRGQEYDPREHAFFVSRMIGACTPDFFARVGGWGLESEIPVFVVGLPRSGTTLIEQILAGHSQVFGAGETKLVLDTLAALGGQGADLFDGLRNLDGEAVRRLASRHLERLQALKPAALRIVDKMPENYLYLGPLASLFPRAKFIHCRRDLRDVAVSCWMTHFRDLRWANDREHIASRFCEHQRLMEHWRKVLPVPLLEVDYEETVADLEGVARKLVAWCGLAWEPQCLEFHRAKRPVRTASAVQVRQPIFRTSVGRWKHYEQSLATLLSAIPSGR